MADRKIPHAELVIRRALKPALMSSIRVDAEGQLAPEEVARILADVTHAQRQAGLELRPGGAIDEHRRVRECAEAWREGNAL